MAELEQGLVTSVEEVVLGDELLADTPAGSTTLVVGDAVDFNEDGGALTVGDPGETVGYSSADLDTDTLTLVAPTAADYAAGEPVLLAPEARERVATVLLDVDGEGVQARIPHALYDRIPEGVREPGQEENITLSLDSGEWVVADVLGREPTIDGAYVDLSGATLPPATDGLPPDTSPDPTVLGGVGVLHVRWPATLNADAVTYDVHLSTSDGFTPDATTLAAQTPGTAITLRALPDGTPLAYDTTYYVRLVARDEDPGEAPPGAQASGQLHRVSNEEISAAYAYLGTLSADAITSGTLDAEVLVSGEVKTSNTGRRVVLDAQGLHLFTSDDKPLVDLPTDATKSASFNGDASMETLTVRTGLSIATQGTVEAGAGLDLVGGVTPPAASPLTYLDHEMGTPLTGHGSEMGTPDAPGDFFLGHQASAFDAAGKWWVVGRGSAEVGSRYRLYRFPRDGGAAEAVWSGTDVLPDDGTYGSQHGLGFDANGMLWLACQHVAQWVWTLRGYTVSGDTVTLAREFSFYPSPSAMYLQGMSVIGTTAYVGMLRDASNYPAMVVEVDLPTEVVTANHVGPTLGSQAPSSRGFQSGPLDFGVHRHVFNVNGTARVFSASGGTLTEDTAKNWPMGSDDGVGGKDPFTWCPEVAEFRQVEERTYAEGTAWGPMLWKRFTGTYPANPTWHVSHTWRDSNPNGAGGTSETTEGTRKAITMLPRYRLRLSLNTPLPTNPGVDDPNAVSFYLGQGDASPTREAMWRQGGVLPDGVTSLVLTSVATSGANPPASNDFPGSTPGFIRAAQGAAKRQDGQPKTYMDGLGAANVDGLIPPGTVNMYAGTSAPPGWALCDGSTRNTATSPDLFAVIGYMFGGSGTTFYLPDLRSRLPLGANPGASTRGALGAHETNDSGNVGGTGPGAGDPGRLGHKHTHTIPPSNSTDGHSKAVGTSTPNLLALRAFDGHNHGGDTGVGGVGPTQTSNYDYHAFMVLNFIIKL